MHNSGVDIQKFNLKNHFSCYLVGEGNLAIQCGILLLEKHHTILGILSPDQQLRDWGSKHQIHVTSHLADFQEQLQRIPFDYLWSIVNRTILSQEILRTPKQATINYHDAPLPRYAGSYATSWAILNNERQHGVTWHVVTEQVDAGDILKQVTFPMDEHETALTLNLKCYEHAYSAFSELVDELAQNRSTPIKQDLTKRSFYPFNKRPLGSGFIRWNQSADQIVSLYRAMNFGDYPNCFGLVKVMLDDEMFIVKEMEALEKTTQQPSGTIIDIHHAIEVATATEIISLKKLTHLNGEEVDLSDLKKKLKSGYVLPIPNEKTLVKLDELNAKVVSHESFWVERMKCLLNPISSSFVDHMKGNKKNNSHCHALTSASLTHYTALIVRYENQYSPEVIGLTVFLLYLYRINDYRNLTIYYSHPKLKSILGQFKGLFSPYVPISTAFKPGMSFDRALEAVHAERQMIERHKTYARDMFCRYPDISNNQLVTWAFCAADSLQDEGGVDCASMTFIMAHQHFSVIANDPTVFCRPDELLTTLVSHMDCLINSILVDRTAHIHSFSILPEQEKKKLLVDYIDTRTPFPSEKLIHHFFEQQAETVPHHIAVSCENHPLTYAQLNKKANQLAHFLRKSNMRENSIVSICLIAKIELIIAMLGVLKAGGAYLLLDPHHPKKYVCSLLEESQSSVLITNLDFINKNVFDLNKRAELTIIPVDEDDLFSQERSDNLTQCVDPHHLAYVIYTSGSTGKPKGVLISHKNLVNSIYARLRYYVVPMEKFLLLLSISFDTASAGIWWPLSCGAELVLLGDIRSDHYLHIATQIKQHQITHVLCVPTLYFSILGQAEKEDLLCLREVILGGENWPKNLIKQHVMLAPHSYLYNEYGQTEATIWSTVKKIYDPVEKKISQMTVGKPIANVQTYVLDVNKELLPIGIPGELYIGGYNVASGYYHDPKKTEKQFISHPFLSTQEWLYKTGDKARWLPNGDLEYLGRVDDQVKIRGYRIELRAIENCIYTLPQVKQCIVIIVNHSVHYQYLVAYVVFSSQDAQLSSQYLRDYLKDYLPDYMIPVVFLPLPELPLTSNGKIDKATLLRMYKKKRKNIATTYLPPQKNTEKLLVSIWSDLLKIDEIGIDDNFFYLGGNSILATQAVLRIIKQFNTKLSLKTFFDHPTIRHLAELIDEMNYYFEEINQSAFLEDAILDPTIQPTNVMKQVFHLSRTPSAILLTGANGFLGVHLLRDLHTHTSAKLYCLVRAKDNHEALKRIQSALLYYQFNELFDSERIIPLCGHLSIEKLGLSSTLFATLAQEVDAIYHNGAWVNHVYDYHSLKATNVDSTVELLRLATTSKLKVVHFISTITAVVTQKDQSRIDEALATSETSPLDSNGYLQTKWVSEKLLANAGHRGIPVRIYRLAWVGGQMKTGLCNPDNNHFLNLVKACIQSGYAPDKDTALNILPVDFTSLAIVMLSLDQQCSYPVFNLSNIHSITWKQLIHDINNYGYPVKLVSYPTWQQKCFSELDEKHALYPFASLYLNNQGADWLSALDHIPPIVVQHTQLALSQLGIEYPRITKSFVYVCLDYLNSIGFL